VVAPLQVNGADHSGRVRFLLPRGWFRRGREILPLYLPFRLIRQHLLRGEMLVMHLLRGEVRWWHPLLGLSSSSRSSSHHSSNNNNSHHHNRRLPPTPHPPSKSFPPAVTLLHRKNLHPTFTFKTIPVPTRLPLLLPVLLPWW